MTIIEAVRQYLGTCPLLADGRLNVDFLPADAATYSVDVTPVQPVLKQYLDGSSVRQFAFTLSTRTYYGEHIRQQIDNLGFFEQFQSWMERQCRLRRLPELDGGRRAQKMEISTSGYVFAAETETAKYQIQCKLTYFQKGEIQS